MQQEGKALGGVLNMVHFAIGTRWLNLVELQGAGWISGSRSIGGDLSRAEEI